MDRQLEIQTSSWEQIDHFLSRFKSNVSDPGDTDAVGENALDQYLLERAAKELRAARASVERK